MLRNIRRQATGLAGLAGLLLTFILPFSIVVYQLISEIDVGIEFAQKEKLGIKYHPGLRRFLEHIIQHRYLINNRVKYQAYFQKKLTFKKSQIQNDIQEIDALTQEVGTILKTTEKWISLKEKWGQLESDSLSLTPKESFDAHSLLINDILSLMTHVGDTSNLILDPVLDSYYLMDTVVTQLPQSIEKTAQLRDLGTNIALRQTITASEKAQIIILSSLIKSSNNEISRGMKVAFEKNPQLRPLLESYIGESITLTNDFVGIIKDKIINVEDIDIQSTEYLAAGTKAIVAQLKLYDIVYPVLDGLLQTRINEFSGKKYFVEIFAILILVALIYVFVAFARNLIKRQQAEEEIRLLHRMTQAISEAQDFHSALGVALRLVCEATGWSYGEAWIPNADKTVLECSTAWYGSMKSLEKFRRYSEKLQIPPGTGLPGKVWSSKQPAWVQDVSIEPDTVFVRAQMAMECGLRAASGIPITVNVSVPGGVPQETQVLAVLVFFMLKARKEDRRLVEMFCAVATQMGSVIQRKAAEAALQKAEEKYRHIFENAVNGIFQTTADGRYLSANSALARIYGYESAEELILNFTDIASQLYVDPKRREQFLHLLEKKDKVSGFESQVYRKDGSIIWISENARAVRDATGAGVYYEGTVEDITKRKVMEEALRYQQEQAELLLLNILPEPIAQRLKQDQSIIADSFAAATVLFADIVGFTQLATETSPIEVVDLLNKIFSAFDRLAEKHGLEKIKTIGDAYMVVGGLPTPRSDHAFAIAEMALDMLLEISQFQTANGNGFSIRIGINSGPVVAGVIGIKKFIYDLWGDTVNVASRMESQGIPGCIQVTEATYKLLQDRYVFEERGPIPVKGKGEMIAYLLKSKVGAGLSASGCENQDIAKPAPTPLPPQNYLSPLPSNAQEKPRLPPATSA